MVFLACMHLALFLALSLSPDNSFVSPWCDHNDNEREFIQRVVINKSRTR